MLGCSLTPLHSWTAARKRREDLRMYGLKESVVFLIGYVLESAWSPIAEPKAKQTLNHATDNDPEL